MVVLIDKAIVVPSRDESAPGREPPREVLSRSPAGQESKVLMLGMGTVKWKEGEWREERRGERKEEGNMALHFQLSLV